VLWGSVRMSGAALLTTRQSAWATGLIWGAGTLQLRPWGVWDGTTVAWSTSAFSADGDNIVWGSDVSAGDNIVWGSCDWGDNIVWGSNVVGFFDGDNIVWGSSDGDNIVWGSADGDNIVWGTSNKVYVLSGGF
jgi:hypothetical protein